MGPVNQSRTMNMKEFEKELSALAKELDTRSSAGGSRFGASVVSISHDNSTVKVKLCTGAFLDVPTSLLKNVTFSGTANYESKRLGLGSAEIDVSTDAGMMIWQMADEINRLGRLLKITEGKFSHLQQKEITNLPTRVHQPSGGEITRTINPSDVILPPESFKLVFEGVAGIPVTVRYDTPPHQHFALFFEGNSNAGYRVDFLDNCFFTRPPVPPDTPLITRRISFFCEAAHGTTIGNSYSAAIALTVALVQETT
jgi:hypothetical protein